MNLTQNADQQNLKAEVVSLRKEVASLQEQLAWFKRQVFGQRSERLVPGQVHQENSLVFPFYNETKEEEKSAATVVPEHKRKRRNQEDKNKISFPEDLPVKRSIIDLPEEEKICGETGQPLTKIGEEVTRKLAHKPGSYYIKEIVRPKYALPKESEGGIRVSELPSCFLPKSRVDESFLADVITRKYADHLPLYRLSEIYGRDGINLPRQVMSQWIIYAGKALEPLYNEILKKIRESKNVFIDESPVDMLMPGKGKVHQAYMWLIAGGKPVGLSSDPPYVYYRFHLDRKHHHASDLLKDCSGVFHSDKYGAYEAIAANYDITWCPCWVHIRRQFIEAETGDLEFRSWVLRKIKYLFMLERVAWGRSESERLEIRQTKEAPIIDEIVSAVKGKLEEGRFPMRSKFRKALGYLLGLKPYLKNYTQYPHARLDNNVAERAVRPLAIGRKNWLFTGSERGGQASAVLLSLVQSCRIQGINPRVYFEDVLRRIMDHNSQRLEELLPDAWLAAQQTTI